MTNMITADDFYKMMLKASKKYMKVIHSHCIIFYIGIRKIKIDIKPRNFAHLIGVSASGKVNEFGFTVTSFSKNSNDFFYDLVKNKIKDSILGVLPPLISKKSYIYEKTDAMIKILEFFSNANDIVLIEVDETELFDTKVKNKGTFRLFNYKLAISFTLDRDETNQFYLKSCTGFNNGRITNSYIKNHKVFPIDKVMIKGKFNQRSLDNSIVEMNLRAKVNNISYDFVSDPYNIYSLEELNEINSQE